MIEFKEGDDVWWFNYTHSQHSVDAIEIYPDSRLTLSKGKIIATYPEDNCIDVYFERKIVTLYDQLGAVFRNKAQAISSMIDRLEEIKKTA